ncbi:MAG: cytochrome c [Steroidobacteraceae bacterium]
MRATRYIAALFTLGWIGAPVHAADYLLMSGKDLYERFCASCHGTSGHGDGPVSKFFKVEVPDLTLIARRHGGKYPYAQIEKIIDGRFIIGAHGTRTMPVWGEEFARTERGNPDAEEVARITIERLSDYLLSLQKSDKPSGVPDDVRPDSKGTQ